MTKSRLFIYIIAGGYVAYTGAGLVKSAVSQRPDHYMPYLVIGLLFVVIGAFFVIKSFLKLSRGEYAEAADRFDEGRTDLAEDSRTEELPKEVSKKADKEPEREREQEGGTDNEDRNGV